MEPSIAEAGVEQASPSLTLGVYWIMTEQTDQMYMITDMFVIIKRFW